MDTKELIKALKFWAGILILPLLIFVIMVTPPILDWMTDFKNYSKTEIGIDLYPVSGLLFAYSPSLIIILSRSRSLKSKAADVVLFGIISAALWMPYIFLLLLYGCLTLGQCL